MSKELIAAKSNQFSITYTPEALENVGVDEACTAEPAAGEVKARNKVVLSQKWGRKTRN